MSPHSVLACLRPRMHVAIIAALAPALVQLAIGFVEQLLDGPGTVGIERETPALSDSRNGSPLASLYPSTLKARRSIRKLGAVSSGLEWEHRELVASQPRDDIRAAEAARQSPAAMMARSPAASPGT